MHHRILIKVRGDSIKEAKGEVEGILEGTICCRECGRSVRGVSWDYVGDILHISKNTLASLRKKNKFWKWDTPEEMAKELINDRQKSMKGLKESLRKEALFGIVQKHLPRKEAALLVDSDDKVIRKRCAEVLKSGEDHPLPQTVEELASFVSELLSNRFSMGRAYASWIESLQNIFDFGNADEGLYVLHSTDNHYADLTECTEGKKVFYFWCDRHH